jgi:hypothetical protein
MSVFDIYSRRKRRAERGEPEVFQYGQVPDQLRWQVVYILETALGPYMSDIYRPNNNEAWVAIRDTLLREKGVSSLLPQANKIDPQQECFEAILNLSDVDDWLDVVELCSSMWGVRADAELRG